MENSYNFKKLTILHKCNKCSTNKCRYVQSKLKKIAKFGVIKQKEDRYKDNTFIYING